MMEKVKYQEALTALIASAFVHHKKIIEDPSNANPPTPEETKQAYQNDIAINRLTKVVVLGIDQLNSWKQLEVIPKSLK